MEEPGGLIAGRWRSGRARRVRGIGGGFRGGIIGRTVRGILGFRTVWFILAFGVILAFLAIGGLLKMGSGIALTSIRSLDPILMSCSNYHSTCSCSFS